MFLYSDFMALTLYRRHQPTVKKGKSVVCAFTGTPAMNKCHCPIWAVGTVEGGDYLRRTTKCRTIAQAQIVADRWEKAGGVLDAPAAQWTIKDALANYAAKRKCGPLRLDDTTSFLEKFEVFCKSNSYKTAGEITDKCLEAFLASDPVWSKSKERRKTLHAFMNFLIRSKAIKTNPVKELEKLMDNHTPTDYLRKHELDPILEALASDQERPRLDYVGPAYAHAYIYLLRWTGMRPGDGLRIGPNNLEKNAKGQNQIRFVQSKTQGRGKTKGLMVMRIPDKLVTFLQVLTPKSPTSYFMKPAKLDGLEKEAAAKKLAEHVKQTERLYDRRLKWAQKKAGVTRHTHLQMLRDTFAIELILKGYQIDYISKLLGHENVAITIKYYLQWVEERRLMMDDTIPAMWDDN